MVTHQPFTSQVQNKNRDDEPIGGFESYHKVGCKLALKRYFPWFPTKDDLTQAAALAAVEAEAQLGSHTTLKPLCRLLDRSIYQQATAYGLRSSSTTTNHKAGTLRTRQNIRREYCLCEVVAKDRMVVELEYHRGAIGVGQFTVQATTQLHRLVNLPDPVEKGDQRKEALRARMHQVLESNPELRALREWYLSRNHHFGYRAMEREGLCDHNKGQRLIVQARRLAGVEEQHSPHDAAMAQKVAEFYRAANDKRTRQLAQELGMSQSSVQKWLTLARRIGLLPPYKFTVG
jgi:hypothetical protein